MSATPDERVLTLGEYLVGVVSLLAILGPLAWAAWRLRAALLPGWSGALARLVEVVLGISLLVVLSQLIGTFGAFGKWPLIVASVVAAGLATWASATWLRRRGSTPAYSPPVPTTSSAAVACAAVACAAVVAGWAVPTLISIAGGMGRADTLWYHMSLTARFVQTGDVGAIHHFDPIFLAAYYPANSEILHAVPILSLGRDFLSPVLNLGFLAIALLGAWCVGRPWGLGPQTMLGGTIALGSQSLIEFNGGQALNDIVGVAFVLAAAGILVNAYVTERRAPGAIAIAGLAAGLAIGTKLSFVAPVLAVVIGVVAISSGRRLQTLALFTIPLGTTGGYWYVRNLVATGNPMPMLDSFGPIGLSAATRDVELRPGFAVAHYWNDTTAWREWFVPGLQESIGVLWPVVILALLAAGVWALLREDELVLRMLGGLVLVSAVAYLFTPLTAAGEEGEPVAFLWNVRFLAPALALGLTILPLLGPLRSTPWRRALTLVGLVALLATTVGSLVQWQQGHLKGALAAAAVTLALFALGALLLRGRRSGTGLSSVLAVLLAALFVAGVAGAGWVLQNHHQERRYQNLSPQLGLAEAVRFGTDLRDARVAIAGVRGIFNQYPFYGTDLSNHVQWLGVEIDDGGLLRIPTCENWREALAEGGYTHVVTMYDPYYPGSLTDTKEALWTREDPASREILRDGPVSVFELDGEPDPAACGSLPDLSPAELDGTSISAQPEANQPHARDLGARP